jgi:ABC-type amino acid transport substrate-binding protein
MCFTVFHPAVAWSEEIRTVHSAGQSWATFTNSDGTGLYHEILNEVFSLYDIRVVHEYATSDRAEELVRLGQADMMLCDDMATPPLVMARYPMYENGYSVFFSKQRVGPWRGPETLRDKEVLSQPGYYSQANFPVPIKLRYIASGAQALGMILLGRSDFYVDDESFIRRSIGENTIAYEPGDFDIRQAGVRSYHPLCNTTERGARIMQLYDDGMRTLHGQGRLKPIYDRWGHPYPDFERR